MHPKTEQNPKAMQEDRVWGIKLEIGEWGKDKQLPTLLAALLRWWAGLILLLWNNRESDGLRFLWNLTHRGSWQQGLGGGVRHPRELPVSPGSFIYLSIYYFYSRRSSVSNTDQ